MVTAHHSKGIAVVSTVRVGGTCKPYPEVIHGVPQAIDRQLKHPAGVYGDRVVGRQRLCYIVCIHAAAVNLIRQRQCPVAVGHEGRRTAVAQTHHKLHILRHGANIGRRTCQGFHLEVIVERHKLEGAGTRVLGITHGVEHIGIHRGYGSTNALDKPVEGSQVHQRAIEVTRVERTRSAVHRHHSGPLFHAAIRLGSSTVQVQTLRVVDIMPDCIARLIVSGKIESVVHLVEARHDVVHEYAIVQRATAKGGAGNIGTLRSCHLNRVVHHIHPVATNYVERRCKQVGITVVSTHYHVVRHNGMVGLTTIHTTQTKSTGTMAGVNLIGLDAHISIAGVYQHHIAAVALHIIQLVVLHQSIGNKLHPQAIGILVAEQVVHHRSPRGTQVGGMTTYVHTVIATDKFTSADSHIVGIAAVDQCAYTHTGN